MAEKQYRQKLKCQAKLDMVDNDQKLKYTGIKTSVGNKLEFGAKVKFAKEVMPEPSGW